MSDVIIRTRELKKSFTVKKDRVEAVAGVEARPPDLGQVPARPQIARAPFGIGLDVGAGEIFGFLGPNGAGKTTTLRMLSTLLPVDEGEAMVAGFDVKKRPKEVRKRIGYVSQLGGADNEATGYEDLLLQGRLYGMSLADTRSRVDELSRTLQLEEFAHRKTKTYSGGQLRRLNVACVDRRSSSSTNRRPAWTPRTARTSGCIFANFATPARPSSSRRTISKKRTC